MLNVGALLLSKWFTVLNFQPLERKFCNSFDIFLEEILFEFFFEHFQAH